MPNVTSDLLAGIYTNFRLLFRQNFLAAQKETLIQQIATTIPSTTDTESYNWLGTVPGFTEWLGDRQMSGLNDFSFSIKNKDWANGLEVDRNAISDNKLGMYQPQIAMLAREAARHPDELLLATLIEGEGTAGPTLAYDGQFFFDTDHAEGTSGNQDNDLAGNGVTPTLLQTDYETGRAAMRNFVDDRGRPLGVVPDTILAPPALEGPFRQVLNSEFFPTTAGDGASSNQWKGAAKLLISEYLTDSNDWYLLSLGGPIRPFIFQTRQAVQFTAITAPTAENVFHRRKFQYGADARYNVGFGMWQMAIKFTNA